MDDDAVAQAGVMATDPAEVTDASDQGADQAETRETPPDRRAGIQESRAEVWKTNRTKW